MWQKNFVKNRFENDRFDSLKFLNSIKSIQLENVAPRDLINNKDDTQSDSLDIHFYSFNGVEYLPYNLYSPRLEVNETNPRNSYLNMKFDNITKEANDLD